MVPEVVVVLMVVPVKLVVVILVVVVVVVVVVVFVKYKCTVDYYKGYVVNIHTHGNSQKLTHTYKHT